MTFSFLEFEVISQKRVRGFFFFFFLIRGSEHQESDESTTPKAECFSLFFRSVWNP